MRLDTLTPTASDAPAPLATTPAPARPADDPGTAGVRGGLAALAAALLALMAFIGLVIPPAVVFAVAFVGLAVALGRTARPAVRWAAVVLPLLVVLVNLPFAIADLGHPEAPASFVPTVAIVVLGPVTAALAFRLVRGRPVRAGRAWAVVGAIVALAGVVSFAQAAGIEDVPAQPGDVTVVADAFAYPERVVADTGDGLFLDNADPVHHTFVIEGQGIAVDLPASSTRRVDLDLAPGTYRFFCDVVGHDTMTGTLEVG